MHKQESGFSLIELLIVVAMVAILAAIAVPSFDQMIKSNRVQTHVSDLRSALHFARSEAVSRGQAVAICGSDNGTACNSSNVWSSGWLVFVDNGAGSGTPADGILNGSEEILRYYTHRAGNSLIVTAQGGGGVNAIVYSGRGFVVGGGRSTLKVCESSGQERHSRALLLESSGRAVNSVNQNAEGIFTDVNGNALSC